MEDGPTKPPLPPLTTITPDLQSLGDYERRASHHIAAPTWAHIQSGSGEGKSLTDNRQQFDKRRFVPRMLNDLSGGSSAITLFGQTYASPIMLAPVAYQKLVHPDGEVATVSAATALDTTMIVSTLASVTLEDIAASANGAAQSLGRSSPPPLWFQLYLQPEREASLNLVRRAEAAGYKVIVVTVDAAVKRAEFPLPDGVDAANLLGASAIRQEASVLSGQFLFGTPLVNAAPTWADIAWLRKQTKLPLVIKGLLSSTDAKRALCEGADGIVVSNHGGRVLDNLVSPMDALAPVVAAVGGQIPIMLDSGIRRGTDVLQALALGATAVLIGRPQLHALAVAGMVGVAHILQILRVELELAMAQTGCRTVADIGPDLLSRREAG